MLPFRSTSPSAPLPAGPAALFVAHPGHELRLHGWLELARPLTFVLTDGSGHTGRSRLASTTRVLEACGARAAAVYGRFRDADLYRAILAGSAAELAATVREIADQLEGGGVRSIAADARELYNPSHDLCRVMADLAVELIRERSGTIIRNFDFATVHPRPAGAGAVTIILDDAALQRKVAAAAGYAELRGEYEAAVAGGIESLRTEVLHPVEGAAPEVQPSGKPYYEVHGERQVAHGYYAEVVRYSDHFLPLVERLQQELGLVPAEARGFRQ